MAERKRTKFGARSRAAIDKQLEKGKAPTQQAKGKLKLKSKKRKR